MKPIKGRKRLTEIEKTVIKLSLNKILGLIILVFEYYDMDPELDKSDNPFKDYDLKEDYRKRGFAEKVLRNSFTWLMRKKLNKLIEEWMRADKKFEKHFNLFLQNIEKLPVREIYQTLKNKGTKATHHV